MSTRLKAGFWTSALIRQAEQNGAFAAVIRKGDPDAGACLVKVRTLDGQAVLYRPVRNMNCLLYTSPSPRDATLSRMPSSA